MLHSIWEWDGVALTGWIATSPVSPVRVRVMPGSVLMRGEGEVLTWRMPR